MDSRTDNWYFLVMELVGGGALEIEVVVSSWCARPVQPHTEDRCSAKPNLPQLSLMFFISLAEPCPCPFKNRRNTAYNCSSGRSCMKWELVEKLCLQAGSCMNFFCLCTAVEVLWSSLLLLPLIVNCVGVIIVVFSRIFCLVCPDGLTASQPRDRQRPSVPGELFDLIVRNKSLSESEASHKAAEPARSGSNNMQQQFLNSQQLNTIFRTCTSSSHNNG